ncbi:MAG: hypothetical protein HC828_10540 [Blastochloris sp.]|nr:hypothetical protein [Blastochloris sp.]
MSNERLIFPDDEPRRPHVDDSALDADDGVIDAPDANETVIEEEVTYRATSSDPTFGLLVAVAVSVGLTPLIEQAADLRYTLAWAALAAFGVLAWLFGSTTRIHQETPGNVGWGVVFGLILGAPMLLAGGDTLATTVRLLFRTTDETPMSLGVVLAYLVFVMPLGETLFFRGLLQHHRPFWLVG